MIGGLYCLSLCSSVDELCFHKMFSGLIKILLLHTHLTSLFPGLPGWAATRKVKSIWILMKQETASGSGVSCAMCKFAPRSRQITMPTPQNSVFYRLDDLPVTQATASKSIEGIKLQIQLHFVAAFCGIMTPVLNDVIDCQCLIEVSRRCIRTLCRVLQYKDAFLKENPTYRWYNPVKHTQPVAVGKYDTVVPPSTTGMHCPATTGALPFNQISAGKLAGNPEHCFSLHTFSGCDGMGMHCEKKMMIAWRNVWSMK